MKLKIKNKAKFITSTTILFTIIIFIFLIFSLLYVEIKCILFALYFKKRKKDKIQGIEYLIFLY